MKHPPSPHVDPVDEMVVDEVMDRADIYAGQRLRERRHALGLTQRQVGLRVGLTVQQVHKYEIGLNRMMVGRLFEIAQALDMPPGWFFEQPNDETRRPFSNGEKRISADVVRAFNLVENVKRQEALVLIARAMAER